MQPRFCSKCGNILKEGDNFCRRCGAPIIRSEAMGQQASTTNRLTPSIPSYSEVEERFNRASSEKQSSIPYNPEGTVLLAGSSTSLGRGKAVRKGNITLSFEDMLRGCSKVVDFGTGKKYEIIIPAGISPGDILVVKDTGIIDPEKGKLCDIELTTLIG